MRELSPRALVQAPELEPPRRELAALARARVLPRMRRERLAPWARRCPQVTGPRWRPKTAPGRAPVHRGAARGARAGCHCCPVYPRRPRCPAPGRARRLRRVETHGSTGRDTWPRCGCCRSSRCPCSRCQRRAPWPTPRGPRRARQPARRWCRRRPAPGRARTGCDPDACRRYSPESHVRPELQRDSAPIRRRTRSDLPTNCRGSPARRALQSELDAPSQDTRPTTKVQRQALAGATAGRDCAGRAAGR